jgi:Holliday junction resolvase
VSGGIRSRRKGARVELDIVHRLRDAGFSAEKIPLSGAAGGSFRGDITMPLLGIDRKIECKARADGFSLLYRWLEGGNFALVVKADRKEPLVVLRLKDALEVAKVTERSKKQVIVT